jgi:glycine cleavage system H protein
VEVNALLTESPEILNKDPYGSGWLVKIKLSDPGEPGKLLTAAEYQAYVGTESS